ncbi:MAG: hypothetical protein ACJATT_000955 [Myxococcota bacterium]
MDVNDWLDDQGAPEADWTRVVLQRAMSGQLGHGGEGVLLDMLALTQPHACRPHLCTPGMRGRSERSCCADLEVSVADEEVSAIDAALPEIALAMQGDARWADGVPTWHEEGALVRHADRGSRRKRCVFAESTPDGLRCVLHRLESETGREPGELKPLPCRLFPLALVAMGDGSVLVTAIHKKTARDLASRPARVFPCLSDGAPPLYESEREVIESVLGHDVYDAIVVAAED